MEEVKGIEQPKQSVSEKTPVSEQDRLKLYGEILHREARSLLVKYLPEALPQEPTDIAFNAFPRYEGKYKGMHYISTDSEATSEARNKRIDKEIKEFKREQKREMDKFFGEMFRKDMQELKEEGYDIPDELLDQHAQTEEDEPDDSEDHWDKLVGSLETRRGYSINTWGAVATTTHELIHQRQHELNPSIAPDLLSPDLNQIDPDKIDHKQLRGFIREASMAYSRTLSEEERSALYWPVIEGMAELGSFYVMGRIEEDFARKGDTETAAKIRKARISSLSSTTTLIERKIRAGEIESDDYKINYLHGIRLIRKLYKQFGRKTPQLLSQVDLHACQQIAKGSPKYQQIMEDPALLPGLHQAA